MQKNLYSKTLLIKFFRPFSPHIYKKLFFLFIEVFWFEIFQRKNVELGVDGSLKMLLFPRLLIKPYQNVQFPFFTNCSETVLFMQPSRKSRRKRGKNLTSQRLATQICTCPQFPVIPFQIRPHYRWVLDPVNPFRYLSLHNYDV